MPELISSSLDLHRCRCAAQDGRDVADYFDRRSVVLGPNGDADSALAPLERHERHHRDGHHTWHRASRGIHSPVQMRPPRPLGRHSRVLRTEVRWAVGCRRWIKPLGQLNLCRIVATLVCSRDFCPKRDSVQSGRTFPGAGKRLIPSVGCLTSRWGELARSSSQSPAKYWLQVFATCFMVWRYGRADGMPWIVWAKFRR